MPATLSSIVQHQSHPGFERRPTRWRPPAPPAKLSSTPSALPSVTSNCLPGVIQSVTSPVILLVFFCKSWLFRAETRPPDGSLLPPPPPFLLTPHTIKKTKTLHRGGRQEGRSPFGCFRISSLLLRLFFLFLFLPRPLTHPLDIHPSVDHQRRRRTGIINLDYLKKRWFMRRAVEL